MTLGIFGNFLLLSSRFLFLVSVGCLFPNCCCFYCFFIMKFIKLSLASDLYSVFFSSAISHFLFQSRKYSSVSTLNQPQLLALGEIIFFDGYWKVFMKCSGFLVTAAAAALQPQHIDEQEKYTVWGKFRTEEKKKGLMEKMKLKISHFHVWLTLCLSFLNLKELQNQMLDLFEGFAGI